MDIYKASSPDHEIAYILSAPKDKISSHYCLFVPAQGTLKIIDDALSFITDSGYAYEKTDLQSLPPDHHEILARFLEILFNIV
ncbi:MAG: hypothetical protein FWH48_04675 [Oscillospiraceae bacterium]|nr:hypothetical protein [Oscillospiraceae bacterium]